MKKYLMSLLALVLGIGTVNALPVGVSQAKYVGQQFVQANFEQSRQSADLTLVYTGTSTRGEACFYVFNVGNNGFVMVSADDYYRPIVGYSDEGAFDAQNINPELGYMLDELIAGRTGKELGQALPQVAAEWEMVKNEGRQMSFNGGRGVPYLVQTKWNQDYPYNYYCPAATGGPGGRTYAGCVATAMSQVMKYWNHPTKGQGSHTNYNSGFGGLSANFGNTTYDWENMPNSISSGSPQASINAVATLMYHCGISVDMHYAIDGSGSYSYLVPGAISSYFLYSNQSVQRSRDNYTYANWSNMLKEQFDMGWPVYYSGQASDGGHAFVCDGYDDANLYHYNWGWSGSGDGWFDFDNIDYNTSDAAVINFVPTAVYNSTPQAPTSFTVTPAENYELAATVSWVNPSKTLNNANISGTIDHIVVTRNGEIIHTEDNVSPGAAMSFVDNTVPRFDVFNYMIYAVFNESHGKVAYCNGVAFGPTCPWTVTITQGSISGFRGGAIHIYNATGVEVAQVTSTNSTVQNIQVNVPLGNVSFAWTPPTSGSAFNMGFSIKDSQNNTVYTYSGPYTDMTEGVFYSSNNSCGNEIGVSVPSNLIAVADEENPNNIFVSWDPVDESGYGYMVYRDDVPYRLIPEGTSFVDENVSVGGHCYYVGFMYEGGENGQYSNESCANSGDCYSPTNIDFEYTGNYYRIKLKWEKPAQAEGLTGYYLFRKFGEDGIYKNVKSISASATTYTDNSANQNGDYYYKLCAYYAANDCTSAPANWIHDSNQFYLHAPYSTDGIGEREDGGVAVFPNPTNSHFTVEGTGLNHITVFNTMGQRVYDMDCSGESVDINLNVEDGIYVVRVFTANGDVTKRITVIR